MATVKNPLFSEEAHGNMSGLEFRRGTYGHVVGRTSLPPHLRTPAQTVQRSRLKLAHTAWEALSESDKQAWSRFATDTITPRNAFIAAALRFATVGRILLPRPVDPAPATTISNVEVLTLFPSTPAIRLIWDYSGSPSNLVAAYVHMTYSNRLTPTPAKLVYSASIPPNLTPFYMPVPCTAPVAHVRLDIIDNNNGSLHGSYLSRFEIAW
jgi:hypothetical protein